MAEPIPTLAQLQAGDITPALSVSSRSALSQREYHAFYQAFVASNGAAFNTVALNRSAYLSYLAVIANYGGSHRGDQEAPPFNVRGAAPGAELQSNPIQDIVRAIQIAVPAYTHQRLFRTQPDHVARAIQLNLPNGTDWADNNGLVDVPARYGFPGANRCTGITVEHKIRLAAASKAALGEDTKAEILNTSQKLIGGYLHANATALNNPRLQITY